MNLFRKLAFLAALTPCLFAVSLAENADSLQLIRENSLPDYAWQKTVSFPDWAGYTDNTLAMNSMASFRFWHNQGTLYLSVNDDVDTFTLYVNSQKIETRNVTAGIWSLDFSSVAKDGINTVQISNIFPLGLKDAVQLYVPYPVVQTTDISGDLEGIRPETIQLISDIIQSDVDYGSPSAQLAIIRNGQLVYANAWGTLNTNDPDSPAVTNDTLYDLASVTKMFSVNFAVQKLLTEGNIDLDAPVTAYLGKGFADNARMMFGVDTQAKNQKELRTWKQQITVRNLLYHNAGFLSTLGSYNIAYPVPPETDDAEAVAKWRTQVRAETLEKLSELPIDRMPGTRTVYSDIDYITLCFIVEQITGQRLDEYMQETFYSPLGLHTTYLPLENGYTKDDIAATELDGNTRSGNVSFRGIRKYTLQGEVHDEAAWHLMGGVSGHAGLFSSAKDLAVLASTMLTGGYGPYRFFSQNVLDLFSSPQSETLGQWGLGWFREGDSERAWYFGTQSGSSTIGHQGWTGTLAMIDPSRNLVIVYLTNKINSPVLGKSGSTRFSGNFYTTGTLGFVPQILSIGMDEDTDLSEQLQDLLADMAAESLKLIPDGAKATDPAVLNSKSKIKLLKTYAADNPELLSVAQALENALPD